MSKKRILIISNTAWSIYNFRKGVIRYLQENNFEVMACAPSDKYAEIINEELCPFYEIKQLSAKGINPIQDFMLINEFCSFYKKHNIDIVISYTIKPNLYSAIASGKNILHISTINGLGYTFAKEGIMLNLVKRLYRFAFLKTDFTFFQNPDDRDLFIEEKIIPKQKAGLTNGSGVNIDEFNYDAKERNEKIIFLLSARLVKEKGVYEFIDAARKIKNKGLEAEFWVLGLPANNPSAISVNKIEEISKEGVINYKGVTDDMNKFMELVDVVVLPSYYREGIPRVLIEACSKGKPIITTDSIGCREAIIDDYNGIMVQPRDVNSLEAAFESFIKMDKNKFIELKKNSRSLAESKFDVISISKLYFNKIQGLLSEE